MNVRILKYNAAAIKSWGAGAGKVCEIYRFPETASDQDYLVRFSTATIEVPQSDFTCYPGYIRHHRTLQGSCVFEIHGSANNTLIDQSGSVFDFIGDTQLTCSLTTNAALATNLIHRPQVQVSDRVLQLDASNMSLDKLLKTPIASQDSPVFLLNIVYVIEGELNLESVAQSRVQHSLGVGDTLITNSENSSSDASIWRINNSSAKVYHGVIAIPR